MELGRSQGARRRKGDAQEDVFVCASINSLSTALPYLGPSIPLSSSLPHTRTRARARAHTHTHTCRYELRDKRYVLDEKNGQTFQAGMLVCLRIGLENLTTASKDDQGKKYALLLADTVIVTEDGAQCLTDGVQRKPKRVQWNVGDEGEEPTAKKDEKKAATKEEIDRRLAEQERQRKNDKMTDAEKAKEREMYEQRNEEIAKQRLEEQIRRRNQGSDTITKVCLRGAEGGGGGVYVDV